MLCEACAPAHLRSESEPGAHRSIAAPAARRALLPPHTHERHASGSNRFSANQGKTLLNRRHEENVGALHESRHIVTMTELHDDRVRQLPGEPRFEFQGKLSSDEEGPLQAPRRPEHRTQDGGRDRADSAREDKAWPVFSGRNSGAQTVSHHVQKLPGSSFRGQESLLGKGQYSCRTRPLALRGAEFT